ncbi:MAG: ASKHA domain-containing protein [Bacillota bacterium]|nr:ASKHA domain-containing protein [Bacillota bacterium]
MYTINFIPSGLCVKAKEGEILSDVIKMTGLKINTICGGKGKCKKCNVFIVDYHGKEEKLLSCQTLVTKNMNVRVPPESEEFEHIVLTEGHFEPIILSPLLSKKHLPALKLQQSDGFLECLKREFSFQELSADIPLSTLRMLPFFINQKENGITAVLEDGRLLTVEAGDTSHEMFGLAVDIGTTTVAAYLYNLNSGEQAAVASALNAQISEGADVMSRIVAASTDDGLELLHQKIISTINNLVDTTSEKAGVSNNHIYSMVMVGNTPMQHLFLRLSPASLGRSPFTAVTKGIVKTSARDLDININPDGSVVFLPLIGGFIGADTTGALLAAGFHHKKETLLLIDIGTNGEIVLSHNGKLLACSTAAGPALEGASISFGMRAASGAIEDIKITDGKVNLRVIGDSPAKGICGSGIVAAAAEMRRTGLLTASGRLQYPGKDQKNSFPQITEINGEKVFVLADADQTVNGKPIYISQKDIRQVQLAKAAIFSGAMLLIEEMGISGEELSEILLAGAFGSFININYAQEIGLLPFFPNVPVHAVGNAAGAGAQAALLSSEILDEAEALVQKIEPFELASHSHFQKRFFAALDFPEF